MTRAEARSIRLWWGRAKLRQDLCKKIIVLAVAWYRAESGPQAAGAENDLFHTVEKFIKADRRALTGGKETTT